MGREGERQREKHQLIASLTPPIRDLAHNPDWESNWRPFRMQAGTQSTEPHQPGPMCILEVQQTRPTEGLHWQCKGKRKFKDDSGFKG